MRHEGELVRRIDLNAVRLLACFKRDDGQPAHTPILDRRQPDHTLAIGRREQPVPGFIGKNIGRIETRFRKGRIRQCPGLRIDIERGKLLRGAHRSIQMPAIRADRKTPRCSRQRGFPEPLQLAQSFVQRPDRDAILPAFGDINDARPCQGRGGEAEKSEDGFHDGLDLFAEIMRAHGSEFFCDLRLPLLDAGDVIE